MSRKSTKPVQTAEDDSNEVSYTIITTQGWNVSEHICGAAKPNKSGQGKSASLTYGRKRFFLKVPKMYCPFGASKPKPQPNQVEKPNESFSVQMSFGDDPECQMFQKKMEEFDQFMIQEALKPDNNTGWLGGSKAKPYSREVVESKYTPTVKRSKDKETGEVTDKYPPFIRVSFPTTFKPPYEFTCEIYDKNNQLMSISDDPTASDAIGKVIPANCWCSALISGSIWCNVKGFGVTWRVHQLKVFAPRGTLPKGKCLVDDPADDDDDESDEEMTEKDDDKKSEIEPVEEEEVIEEDETAEVVNEAPASDKMKLKAKK